MKLSIATALLAITGTAAFSPATSGSASSSLKSSVASDVYTFTKSNEIFEEAKTVSGACITFLILFLVFLLCIVIPFARRSISWRLIQEI